MEPSMRPVLATIQSLGRPLVSGRGDSLESQVQPFVTISRQAGAPGGTLAAKLVQRLREADPGEPAWSTYDRELVERIARDQNVSRSVVEAFEDQPPSMLLECLEGLRSSEATSGFKLYRAVAAAILAVAKLGRAVIVGRGGMFVTEKLPGGVHVHIVATMDDRVEHIANLRDIPLPQARHLVQELEHNRRSFYRRYWPHREVTPDAFSLTLNASHLDEARMVDAVLPLVKRAVAQTAVA